MISGLDGRSCVLDEGKSVHPRRPVESENAASKTYLYSSNSSVS